MSPLLGNGTVIRRVFAVLVATSLSTACGDSGEPETTAPESLAGTYNLVSVNSMPLPVVEGQSTLTAGVLTLGGDGSATLSLEVNDISVEVFTGTYTVSGSMITLDGVDIDGDPDTYTGTVSGNTITLSRAGNDFEFRKVAG